MRPDKEHNPGEMEEVVENEMATDGSRGVDGCGIRGEEVRGIDQLEDKHDDKVDGGNDCILGEARVVVIVLVPNATPKIFSVGRRMGIVVNGGDDGQEPGEK